MPKLSKEYWRIGKTMVEGKCWECRFYNSTRRGEGECRRMPPPWRFVDSGDWCGEFVHKLEKELEMKGIKNENNLGLDLSVRK